MSVTIIRLNYDNLLLLADADQRDYRLRDDKYCGAAMATKQKPTPPWWQYLMPSELRFAKDYFRQKVYTAEMAKKYRLMYGRAKRRLERKERT
jgi:hypothetical protein